MTNLLLDTTFLVDAERARDNLDDLIADEDDVAVAAISIAELRVGVDLAARANRPGRERQHRALSLVDALVAAVAEARGLTVLHYDGDFELVAEVTGQPHQWIVARGTAD